MTPPLVREYNRFTELRRRLLEADPEIDETTLLDTLEGATDLNEAIGEVIRAALEEEALADGLRARMATMRERLERIEVASAKKREVAQAVMEDAGIEKILAPDFTVSLRISPPGVAVVNEAEIPEQFWIPQAPKLDRKGILDALKAGSPVPGATFSNSKVSLAIRTK
ncbi:siphovirus Gp157 family protein [Aestuariivirga sp.]|uniref:siphovirus Gp157 family protein n=1 Tax=Aestuariivirga sp. TaxID=2650926 RepID=UPI00391A84F4